MAPGTHNRSPVTPYLLADGRKIQCTIAHSLLYGGPVVKTSGFSALGLGLLYLSHPS